MPSSFLGDNSLKSKFKRNYNRMVNKIRITTEELIVMF